MAVIERDVVLIGKDASGNETIDFPIARLGNIEGNADIKDAPEAADYIPLMDNSDRGQMKKTPVSALTTPIADIEVLEYVCNGLEFTGSDRYRPYKFSPSVTLDTECAYFSDVRSYDKDGTILPEFDKYYVSKPSALQIDAKHNEASCSFTVDFAKLRDGSVITVNGVNFEFDTDGSKYADGNILVDIAGKSAEEIMKAFDTAVCSNADVRSSMGISDSEDCSKICCSQIYGSTYKTTLSQPAAQAVNADIVQRKNGKKFNVSASSAVQRGNESITFGINEYGMTSIVFPGSALKDGTKISFTAGSLNIDAEIRVMADPGNIKDASEWESETIYVAKSNYNVGHSSEKGSVIYALVALMGIYGRYDIYAFPADNLVDIWIDPVYSSSTPDLTGLNVQEADVIPVLTMITNNFSFYMEAVNSIGLLFDGILVTPDRVAIIDTHNNISKTMVSVCKINNTVNILDKRRHYALCQEGMDNFKTGKNAHVEGAHNIASGENSHSEGYCTRASNYASHCGGKYSQAMTTGGEAGNITGDAFVIGNGTGLTELSNAFRVTYTGETYGLSAFNSSGADYAEYFEWSDGNTDNEDRVGYFVTLEGKKIRIANPDDYVLGIVSGQPCIIGNADEDWLGRWEHDEYGRFILEYLDENGKVVDHETPSWRHKANPEYDNTQEYIERKDRPEWSAVGMLGVLSVRDDGSCTVNGFCKVKEGGIATAASDELTIQGGKIVKAYRVIERVSDNVVKIVFR